MDVLYQVASARYSSVNVVAIPALKSGDLLFYTIWLASSFDRNYKHEHSKSETDYYVG